MEEARWSAHRGFLVFFYPALLYAGFCSPADAGEMIISLGLRLPDNLDAEG